MQQSCHCYCIISKLMLANLQSQLQLADTHSFSIHIALLISNVWQHYCILNIRLSTLSAKNKENFLTKYCSEDFQQKNTLERQNKHL